MATGTPTPNLGLNVWQGADYVLRTEMNQNFSDIDTFAGTTVKLNGNSPFTTVQTAPAWSVSGLTGALNPSRYVGSTAGAAPTSGAFQLGDWIVDYVTPQVWICTSAGSPGTWKPVGTTYSAGTGLKLTGTQFAIDGSTTALTNYLRIDSGAPNPQTVQNKVGFVSSTTFANSTFSADSAGGSYAGWGQLTPLSSGKGMLVWNGVDQSYGPFVASTVTTNAGQLGSASGSWTPASGSFNVAAGTVINVAPVPSGAKLFHYQVTTGQQIDGMGWGTTTPSGSAWATAPSSGTASVYGGYAPSLSSSTATGQTSELYDGSYFANGYFQINNGYLQFVITGSGSNTGAVSTVRWGVS